MKCFNIVGGKFDGRFCNPSENIIFSDGKNKTDFRFLKNLKYINILLRFKDCEHLFFDGLIPFDIPKKYYPHLPKYYKIQLGINTKNSTRLKIPVQIDGESFESYKNRFDESGCNIEYFRYIKTN